MTAAIRADGRVVGAIGVDSEEKGVFTPEQLKRLEAFADQAGNAVREPVPSLFISAKRNLMQAASARFAVIIGWGLIGSAACHRFSSVPPSRFNFVGLIKAARAIGWGIGLAMLFVEPIIGLLILIVALVATIYLAHDAVER